MYRTIWWALALTSVVVAAVGWWQGWDLTNAFVISKDWLKTSVIGETVDTAVTRNKQAAQNFLNKAIEQQKQTALSSIDEVKNSMVTGAQQQAAAVLNSIEKNIGLEKADGAGVRGENFALVITARVNESISFLIKNKTGAPADFSVDWGDSRQTTGALSPREEKIISHAWQTAGDHTIAADKQEFLIRVIK